MHDHKTHQRIQFSTMSPRTRELKRISVFFLLFTALVCLSACNDHKSVGITESKPVALANKHPALPLTWRDWLNYLPKVLSRSTSATHTEMNEALTTLVRLSERYPSLRPQIELKRAEIFFSRGLYERGVKVAQAIWGETPLLERESRLLIAANAQSCSTLEEY